MPAFPRTKRILLLSLVLFSLFLLPSLVAADNYRYPFQLPPGCSNGECIEEIIPTEDCPLSLELSPNSLTLSPNSPWQVITWTVSVPADCADRFANKLVILRYENEDGGTIFLDNTGAGSSELFVSSDPGEYRYDAYLDRNGNYDVSDDGAPTSATITVTVCEDECSAEGAKLCTTDYTGYQTCGYYDADSCLDWSSTTSCSEGETCENGNCQSPSTFSFKLSLNPASDTVAPGESISTTVTAYRTDSTSAPAEEVTFRCMNLPTDASCSFNPTSCIAACLEGSDCDSPCSSTVTISIPDSAPTMQYPAGIVGRTSSIPFISAQYDLTVIEEIIIFSYPEELPPGCEDGGCIEELTPIAPPACTGPISLTFSSTSVPVEPPEARIVTATISVPECTDKIAKLQIGSTVISTDVLPEEGTVSLRFFASSDIGEYTYDAYVDRNSNNDYTDDGEPASATLTVVPECVNDCSPGGATQCSSDYTGYKTCGYYDADSCLDWSSTLTSCSAGETCMRWVCEPSCTDSDGDTYGARGTYLPTCTGSTTLADCDDRANGADGTSGTADDGANINPGATEICDGLDNDCDSTTLDGSGETWLAQACDGTDADLCTEGIYTCLAGTKTCSDTTGDTVEVCDGSLDEDCDGSTDEGCSCTNGATQQCGTTDVGACEYGLQTCAGGSWGDCIGNVESTAENSAETCTDNIDNDCDETIDCEDTDCSSDLNCITVEADTTPPTISNIQVTDITSTSARFSWTTDEEATTELEFGETSEYGGRREYGVSETQHAIALVNLLPSTTYHYRVSSTDASENVATSEDFTFTTLAAEGCTDSDGHLPIEEQYFIAATATANSVTREDACLSADAIQERICQNEEITSSVYNCPQGCINGACVSCTDSDGDGYDNCESGYVGADEKAADCNNENSAINPGATEICGNNIDEDCDGEDLTCETPVTSCVPSDEICDDNLDNDCDEQTDCSDSDCSADSACQAEEIPPAEEYTYPGNLPPGCENGGCIIELGAPIEDTEAPIISEVSVTPTDTSATITWTTDEPSTSQINYGETDSQGATLSYQELVTLHSIILQGLSASTTYHYQITSIDSAGNSRTSLDATFTTASTSVSCTDSDGDGYGTAGSTGCTNIGTDCNDGESLIHPGATEVCDGNGVDENCDGTADEGCGCTVAGQSRGTSNQNGPCAGNQEICQSGAWVASSTNYNPTTEICGNNIDEDCSGADLTCAAGCTRVNPQVTITPTLQEKSIGDPQAYTATITNKDNSACGSATFSLAYTCPASWICALDSTTLAISPQASATATVTITSPATATAGEYTFSVTATNSEATSYLEASSAVYKVAAVEDKTAPTITISSPSSTTPVVSPFNIIFTITDAQSGISKTSLQYKLGEASPISITASTSCTGACETAGEICTCTISGLTGTNSVAITIMGKDASNNEGSVSSTFTIVLPPTETETESLSIAANVPKDITIDITDVAVEKITVTPKEAIASAAVTVKSTTPPTGTPTPSGIIYQYVDIAAPAITEDNIKSADITFKVDKSWIVTNKINSAAIKLNRYKDGKWETLATTKVSEDATTITYKASTPGFSVFAITGEVAAAPSAPKAPSKPSTSSKGTTRTGCLAKDTHSHDCMGNETDKLPTAQSCCCNDNYEIVSGKCTAKSAAAPTPSPAPAPAPTPRPAVQPAPAPEELEEIPPAEGKTPAWFWGITAAIILAILLAAFYFKRDKLLGLLSEIEEHLPTTSAGVKGWVKKALAAGYTADVIKKQLKQAGWTEEKIVDLLKPTFSLEEQLPAIKSDVESWIKTALSSGYAIEAIKQILAKAGWEEYKIEELLRRHL